MKTADELNDTIDSKIHLKILRECKHKNIWHFLDYLEENMFFRQCINMMMMMMMVTHTHTYTENNHTKCSRFLMFSEQCEGCVCVKESKYIPRKSVRILPLPNRPEGDPGHVSP